MKTDKYIRWFEDLDQHDKPAVGGKNASLGEMIQTMREEGIRVPGGFATTAQAYRDFISTNELEDQIIDRLTTWHRNEASLDETGRAIRRLFRSGTFPEEVAAAVRAAYRELSERYDVVEVDVAARSSATAEDLPEASFAGQQETFLNVTGEEELLDACRNCFASLFTDRAITYREEQGFDHMDVALSVGVQKMVRADKAGSGVLFTIDTETGFPDVVVINAAWGLGDNVVQGIVNPDEYRVFTPLIGEAPCPIIAKTLGSKVKKMVYARGGSETTRNMETSERERNMFVLTDEEIIRLAGWGKAIAGHYGRPMDIEWAKDGELDELFIVQARPETVQSQKQAAMLHNYSLQEKSERLVTGLAIGHGIAAAETCVIEEADEMQRFREGAILVTGMTDPDWVPIMKQAAGIITDHGGRTSHAAIVSRELGIPAVVGAGKATTVLADGQDITLSCIEGDEGVIYDGLLPYDEEQIDLAEIPEIRTTIMMNSASPGAAFRWWRLPIQGVGLARMEFIINNVIQIHPLALLHPDRVEDEATRDKIEELTGNYGDKGDYFVEHLSRGIASIAAAQYPHPVIVRLSDFKTNEYADLIGGQPFEPEEANPMLGWRGASRYYDPRYAAGFALECRALRRAREEMGFENIVVMVPFCRTLAEADRVLEEMARNGLERGSRGLQVYVMAEIPSNIFLAREFGQRFDGISIGSNDLTQLILGVDRDSELLSELFDERDEAIKEAIRHLISETHAVGTPVGICGQAPSDYPEFAAFLVRAGIDSISLNPDSVIDVIGRVAQAETEIGG